MPENMSNVKYPAPGRRVVTGLDASGKSIITHDGLVPESATWSEPEAGSGGDLWILKNIPFDLTDSTDPLDGYTMAMLPLPFEGAYAIVRMFTWNPGFVSGMHCTDTIDFVFLISGQLEMILENGSTILQVGDTVVQRGTMHDWRVVGNEPCTLVGIMIGATPRASQEQSL